MNTKMTKKKHKALWLKVTRALSGSLTVVALLGLALFFLGTDALNSAPAGPPYTYHNGRFGFGLTRSASDAQEGDKPGYLNAGWYWDWSARGASQLPPLTYFQTVRFKPLKSDGEQVGYTASPTGTRLLNAIARAARRHLAHRQRAGLPRDGQYDLRMVRLRLPRYVSHHQGGRSDRQDRGGQHRPAHAAALYVLGSRAGGLQGGLRRAAARRSLVDAQLHPLREVLSLQAAGRAVRLGLVLGARLALLQRILRDRHLLLGLRSLGYGYFKDRLVDFRQWMYDNGYRNHGLVLPEYGILFYEGLVGGDDL